MSTQSKTKQQLYSELQASEIVEAAEDKFHSDNIKRRRVSERIAHQMPYAIIVVVIAGYILSAPYTVGFFERITPDIIWGWGDSTRNLKWHVTNIAPIVIEGFIFVLSAMRAYGKKKLGFLIWFLLVFSTLVNIIGGIAKLQGDGITSLIDYGYVGISVIAGILISFVSYKAGSLIIELSTGEITMEIDTSKAWQGTNKYNALKAAFYNAALKHGATPGRAIKYAQVMADSYRDTHIEEQSEQSEVVRAVPNDFGFSGIAQVQASHSASKNSQNTMGLETVQTVYPFKNLTQKKVKQWIKDNPDAWQGWIEGDTKYAKAACVAINLTGNTTGYKTVARVFDELEIKL